METIIQDLNARFVERAKPGDLRRTIRRLGFRNTIEGRHFDASAFADGQHGFSPEQILSAARRQLHLKTRHLHENARLRVRYFYQAQMSPQPVRDAIHNKGLSAMTILAGHGRRFPKNCTFRSLDSVQLMTLTMRRDRPNDAGMLSDHFDVKLHVMELDRQEGVIRLGGSGLVDNQPFSRTVMSCDFSREPGRSHQAVPRARVDIIEAALACHESLETAAVSEEMGYQRTPVLPRLYVGFKDGAVPKFDTPALKRSAMSHVLKWMRKGLAPEPGSAGTVAWQTTVIPKLMTIDPDSLEDWSTLSTLLGASDSEYLLTWMLEKSITEHDGLHLVPLSFFPKDSIREIMADVDEVYVRVNDHLGREQFTFEGATLIDRRLGKLQTLQLPQDTGTIGNVRFDFTSTEVGKEHEFA